MQSSNNLKLEDQPRDPRKNKEKKNHPAFSGFFLQSEGSEMYFKKIFKKSFIQNEGMTAGK